MKNFFCNLLAASILVSAVSCSRGKEYVDYVNPYLGNISHILVPAYPTIHLPNSMLRVYPDRSDYTSEYIGGLPVIVTNHREKSAFKIWPSSNGLIDTLMKYNYDNERITPYGFEVDIQDNSMHVSYALSHQSAVYEIRFDEARKPSVGFFAADGELKCEGRFISGWQRLPNDTFVYIFAECQNMPEGISLTDIGQDGKCVVLDFRRGTSVVRLRYGVSFISSEQAEANLRREINTFNVSKVACAGREKWNRALAKIEVTASSEDELATFYSFYYRTFERPICLSEDGRYFSAWDHSVHEDNGQPFYVDDWLWDTYRAAHPLRCLTDAETEEDIIASFLRMAQQKDLRMPTFPEVNGDSRRMNSNHGVSVVAEAMAMNLNVDAPALYEVCAKGIDDKTLAPWSGADAGWIDEFYKCNGYIPALSPGEMETDPNVDSFEKRQPVAVTLGTSYDQWCLYKMAVRLGMKSEAETRASRATDYRNLFNEKTLFFHPKDKGGRWIEGIDYSTPGGLGAREYYGENNAWVYRWDVPHNVSDLVALMGGAEAFCNELDRTFGTPITKSKFKFYSVLPDHTGNVGQFSMANEPAMHVPYLYNYAGKPWKTQKRIRQMLDTWFRNDLMGIPGDEDGGGMSSFVVFSSLGFYPVTPGTAAYNIGSPLFSDAVVHLSNGNDFRIVAEKSSPENKYIQNASLNGKDWNRPWFSYFDIKDGAVLRLTMGSQPNKMWGADSAAVPPSAGL